MKKTVYLFPLLFGALFLSACSLAPPVVLPDIPTPATFDQPADELKGGLGLNWIETSTLKPADPSEWWKYFNDPQLNELMLLLPQANPSVQIVRANIHAAQSQTQASFSNLLPNLGASASQTEMQIGQNASSVTAKLALNASWEIDLWGKNGSAYQASQYSALAAEFDYQDALLSAQASLAAAWGQLRGSLLNRELLRSTILENEKIHTIALAKEKAGVGSASDTAVALSALETAKSNLQTTQLTLETLQHAISLLVGQAPGAQLLPEPQGAFKPMLAQLEIPSSLLLRRPDVRAAATRLMSANEQIGSARSAWFPSLTLSGSNSWSSNGFSGILAPALKTWAFGPAAALTLIDFGARSAILKQSEAGLEKATATYRQVSLQALSDAADALSKARLTAIEAQHRLNAAQASHVSTLAAIAQYRVGTISMLNLSQTISDELLAQRTLTEAQTRLYVALIYVARTFAGGVWEQ